MTYHVLYLSDQGKNVWECGCGLYHPTAGEVSFHYCPTHAAAPELLEALQWAVPQLCIYCDKGIPFAAGTNMHDLGNGGGLLGCGADVVLPAIAKALGQEVAS